MVCGDCHGKIRVRRYVSYYLISNLQLSSHLWFDNLEGGNGRTRIWAMYLDYMKQHGVSTLLLGLGTVSQKETLGWYPHSLILAHYFHFGVSGMLFLIYQIWNPAEKLYLQKKTRAFYFCLLLLAVMMFFPHGSYYEPLFWVIIGVSFGSAYSKFNLITKE